MCWWWGAAVGTTSAWLCGQGLAWLKIIPAASRVLCACHPLVYHELQGEVLRHFPLLSEKIQNLFLSFYVFII